jgi:hypothetical protein
MGRACITNGGEEECIQDIGGKGMRLLERPKRSWMYNKLDLREIEWAVWTELIWLRIGTSGGALVNAVMNLRIP